jgi:hypothetical protein
VQTQVLKYVTEEKVEPVQVQVMKYVTEERTMQVPRTVEKRTPHTYTVRMPRTVVTRVPLDGCGNPLPAAAARPTTGAANAPAISSTEAARLRTPHTAEKPVIGQGEAAWGKAESLEHFDPRTGSSASRAGAESSGAPADAKGTGGVEPIPAPAAKGAADAAVPAEKQPTVATPGPEVYPPPPASDNRDTPAAKTSVRPWLFPAVEDRGHTT